MSQINIEDYKAKYISNSKVEWLIEHGKVNETVFFRGLVGDRYNIYTFTKVSKKCINIYNVWNEYSQETSQAYFIGCIKSYKLTIKDGTRNWSWRNAPGDTLKQLLRQGVCSRGDKLYSIRYLRSCYVVKYFDKTETAAWPNMTINLKTGLPIGRIPKQAKLDYNKAKETDKAQRKRNYIANRENTKALNRYRKAGGDTEFARGGWDGSRWKRPEVGAGTENIDWSQIPIDDVFRHRNATLRSNIIEHYGMNAIIATLDYEVVDEDTIDGRYYKLLDVTIPDFSNTRGLNDTSNNTDSYKGLYLEMINPSTGESHFEGIPNVGERGWNSIKEGTVKAALSWRDNDASMKSLKTWDIEFTSDSYTPPEILT